MNHDGHIIRAVRELCEFLAERCADRKILDELARVAADRSRWHKGRHLFDLARDKTLKRTRGESRLESQFMFEEICAIGLARQLGVEEREITRIVAG